MRSLVQNLLAAKPNPIGIDFGSDFLRLAQVRAVNGHLHLLAAEQRDVPPETRKNWSTRADFFVNSLREILAEGKFVGRQVVLGLPASSTFFGHLRLPKMDEQALAKALPWEIRGKLPIEPEQAVLRHIVAGEVFSEQETRDEIIVMASRREIVQGLLAAAQKARLDVVGMNLEIGAIVDCFAQVYRRKGDDEAINCFLDIGSGGSRVIVSSGRRILFVRAIPSGCAHLNAAVATELNISIAEAALRRRRLAERPVQEPALITAGAPAALAGAGAALADDRRRDLREIESDDPDAEEIALAAGGTVEKIVEELTLCRRYYDSTFPGKPINRLIFVGGGAADRQLCRAIAQGIAMPAQVGDPLVRCEGRDLIDQGTRLPQPPWVVAMGLSMEGIS